MVLPSGVNMQRISIPGIDQSDQSRNVIGLFVLDATPIFIDITKFALHDLKLYGMWCVN